MLLKTRLPLLKPSAISMSVGAPLLNGVSETVLTIARIDLISYTLRYRLCKKILWWCFAVLCCWLSMICMWILSIYRWCLMTHRSVIYSSALTALHVGFTWKWRRTSSLKQRFLFLNACWLSARLASKPCWPTTVSSSRIVLVSMVNVNQRGDMFLIRCVLQWTYLTCGKIDSFLKCTENGNDPQALYEGL